MTDADEKGLIYSASSICKAWIGWRWKTSACIQTPDGIVIEQGKGWEWKLLNAHVNRNRWLVRYGADPLPVENLGTYSEHHSLMSLICTKRR